MLEDLLTFECARLIWPCAACRYRRTTRSVQAAHTSSLCLLNASNTIYLRSTASIHKSYHTQDLHWLSFEALYVSTTFQAVMTIHCFSIKIEPSTRGTTCISTCSNTRISAEKGVPTSQLWRLTLSALSRTLSRELREC